MSLVFTGGRAMLLRNLSSISFPPPSFDLHPVDVQAMRARSVYCHLSKSQIIAICKSPLRPRSFPPQVRLPHAHHQTTFSSSSIRHSYSTMVDQKLPQAEYRQLGKSGLRVSVPILGTMSIGDKRWADWVIEEDEVSWTKADATRYRGGGKLLSRNELI